MTPMFEQFHRLKAAHPDALLFFRMGDFYEMFFEDAVVGAKALELTLTARNKQNPNPVPMCGVPHHAAPRYIQRLVEQGFRVAIAEQVEDPALAKGLVKREVVRVVTPGLVFDPTVLQGHSHNWLAVVTAEEQGFALCILDASTGDCLATTVGSVQSLNAELARHQPSELIIEPSIDEPSIKDGLPTVCVSTLKESAFALRSANKEVLSVTNRPASAHGLQGAALRAVGAAFRYAKEVLGKPLFNIQSVLVYAVEGFMVVDGTTRRNLELFRTLLGGAREGSLLSLLDRSVCALGARRLSRWLSFPLLDRPQIAHRHAAVEQLIEQEVVLSRLRQALREVADIERLIARLTQGTAHARDLVALRRSLGAVPLVREIAMSSEVLSVHAPSDAGRALFDYLNTWLVDEAPISVTEGGVIRQGADSELDELIRISVDGVSVITRLEAKEREQTTISTLKIKRNKVFGYFLEVTRPHVHKVPDRFMRKQTLSNCERYITVELKELEDRVLGADERRKSLEYQHFVKVRDHATSFATVLKEIAIKLSELDALGSLATVAYENNWTRPKMVDEPVVEVVGGRHPMVEAAMDEERFVPNDVHLNANRQLIILTGPNMSGKSTVMRQVALIVLLAQMGSFVPAEAATVGIRDRVFTRVGASDDLRRGQSTFMVEMAETASILHGATASSLVILDEIGRGTSTYDGLSIAWSVAEDLSDRVGCLAMFATHYHELCALAASRPTVINQSVGAREVDGDIVFLRRLVEGGASRSYGIQCARLAGLPEAVVSRARILLADFEARAPKNLNGQLSLFSNMSQQAPTPPVQKKSKVEVMLEGIRPDEVTPRQAHELLYSLKQALKDA